MKHYLMLISLIVLTACQKNTNMTTASNDATILKSQWVLIAGKNQGKTIPVDDSEITLQIDEQGNIAGHSGVNQYRAAAKIDQTHLQWLSDGIATTRMAGLPRLMQLEHSYLNALQKAKTITINNGKLQLSGEQMELQFQRQ